MGFLSGSSAGKRAAKKYSQYANMGIRELRGARDSVVESLQPLSDLSTQYLPQLQQGTTVDGYADVLQAIRVNPAFQDLIQQEQNQVNAELANAGLRRSGAGIGQIAAVPMQFASRLEGMLRDRQSGLFGQGVNALGAINNTITNTASGISNIRLGQGQAFANGILSDAKSKAGGLSSALGFLSSGLEAAGGAGLFGDGKWGEFFGALSDERLKTNIRPVGELNGLTVYEWDWVEGAEQLGKAAMTRGFMAQEVQEKYPEYVHETKEGYLVVDYDVMLEAA